MPGGEWDGRQAVSAGDLPAVKGVIYRQKLDVIAIMLYDTYVPKGPAAPPPACRPGMREHLKN